MHFNFSMFNFLNLIVMLLLITFLDGSLICSSAHVDLITGFCFFFFRLHEMFKESEDILMEALGTFSKLCGEENVQVANICMHIGETYLKMEQFKMSRFAISSC